MLAHTYGKRASTGSVDVDSIISRLLKAPIGGIRRANAVTENELTNVCQAARKCFTAEASLLYLEAPILVCGNIHGQYQDLLTIFNARGTPDAQSYLFLGDYVDRGTQSIECLALLFAYKLRYPDQVFLLRGNHETASMNVIYGFYDECKRRYSSRLWEFFVNAYETLPIAAVISSKIFACHGGLSPHLTSLADVEKIHRPAKAVDSGLLCDLLWSDPDEETLRFAPNNERGLSYVFGAAVVNEFLETNDLDLIVRAHQVVEDGYEFFNRMRLVTIFSVPNYCGEKGNHGAVMNVSQDLECSFTITKGYVDNVGKVKPYIYLSARNVDFIPAITPDSSTDIATSNYKDSAASVLDPSEPEKTVASVVVGADSASAVVPSEPKGPATSPSAETKPIHAISPDSSTDFASSNHKDFAVSVVDPSETKNPAASRSVKSDLIPATILDNDMDFAISLTTDSVVSEMDPSEHKNTAASIVTDADFASTVVPHASFTASSERKDCFASVVPMRRTNANSIDIDSIISRLNMTRTGGIRRPPKVTETELTNLCDAARDALLKDDTLLNLDAPMMVCGDIHGQFTDLRRIFLMHGSPAWIPYLFLGDYVDRGSQSVESLALLLAYKVKYPNRMFILRGNHESSDINMIYGFYDECKRKYTIRLWDMFTKTYDAMPLAAVINGRIFAVHGGISPALTRLEQIQEIRRPLKDLSNALVRDLLWSDPKNETISFAPNKERGVSFYFGVRPLEKFLNENGLDLVIRAHEVVEDGYRFFAKMKLVTVFSAPNYCGDNANLGAVLQIDASLKCRFHAIRIHRTDLTKKEKKQFYYLNTKILAVEDSAASAVGSVNGEPSA